MKTNLSLILLLAATCRLSAQIEVTTGGNVGVGTTNPSNKLDVNGNARVTGYAGIGGAPVSNRALVTYAPSSLNLAGEFIEYAGIHAIQIRPNNSGFNLITSDYWSGSAFLPLALSARGVTNDLVLMTNGNVGIGTTLPGGRLDVEGGKTLLQSSGSSYSGAEATTLSVGGTAAVAANIGQVRISDSTTNAKALLLGYDGSNNLGFISTYYSGVSYTNLSLAPNGGNVGIGTTNPVTKLEVNGGILAVRPTSGSLGYMAFNPGGTGYAGYIDWYKSGPSRLAYMGYQDLSGNEGNLGLNLENGANFIVGGGNVGIGTAAPSQKLHVAGSVKATSFISDTTNYADFVFKPGYQLASLTEVERHIREHGTLPGVPSAAQVAKEGIDLGAMQVKLLQKVEELTLHVIALEKRTRSLEEENRQLRTTQSTP